jgi:O-succinylbenzoic acid--CoA ligase
MSSFAEMKCPIAGAARNQPDAAAYIAGNRTWSYAAMDLAVRSAEEWFSRFDQGDVIAVHSPSAFEVTVIAWACVRRGLVFCPLSLRVPDATRIKMIEQVGARCLVYRDAFPVDDVVESHAIDDIPMSGASGGGDQGSRVLVTGNPATILFTSGSSGEPKGVLHVLQSHVASALASNASLSLGPGDRWLLSLPTYHVGGLAIMFRCMLAGATMVLADTNRPIHDVLSRARITHVSLVGAQLAQLIGRSGRLESDLAIKHLLLGGGPIDAGLVRRARAQGLPVRCTYGMTEMASQVATESGHGGAAMPGSCGRVLSAHDVRVSDRGEIEVRGPARFEGYVSSGELLRPFSEGGWFATGDCGRVEEDGTLWVNGRSDNMFVSGGENIHPEEIEVVIQREFGIAPVAVVPVPDANFGCRAVVFVEESAVTTLRQALDALRAHLPGFKIPRTVLPWPREIAWEPTIDRQALAEIAPERSGP